jgi:hypothetical protein
MPPTWDPGLFTIVTSQHYVPSHAMVKAAAEVPNPALRKEETSLPALATSRLKWISPPPPPPPRAFSIELEVRFAVSKSVCGGWWGWGGGQGMRGGKTRVKRSK